MDNGIMDLDKDYTRDSKFKVKTPNMVHLLDNRSRGISSPLQVQRAMIHKRASDLEISRQSSLSHYHTCEVTAIDLEKPRERFLITGSGNGGLAIHDLWNFTRSPLFTAPVNSHSRNAHEKEIKCVQWDECYGSRVVSSGLDKHVKLWDVNPMTAISTFQQGHEITDHHLSARPTAPKLIAVGMQYPGVILMDYNSGTIAHELSGHRIAVSNVKWSPSDDFLLASAGIDGRIFLWDIRFMKAPLKCLDGELINESQASNSVVRCKAHDTAVSSLKFLNDGLSLVSHCTQGKVKLWNVKTGKLIDRTFSGPVENHSGIPIVMDICWSGSDPLLFVPCNLHILTYNLYSGTRHKIMIGHTGYVTGCVYYSNTCELYSAGKDTNIIKWTVNKPTGLKRITREAWVWI